MLRRLAPGWAGDGEAADPGHDRVLDPTVVLGEGVLAVLHELHGGAGCLLVLEDLHWADADTLDLVSYLAGAVPSAPVLLVLTARDDVAASGIAQLANHPAVTTLGLTRLDAAGVAALAAACRGGALRARGITSREADVLALVAGGLTNAQVATRLFLSPRTVETHVASLLAKTGTAARAELRVWAAAQDVPRLTP